MSNEQRAHDLAIATLTRLDLSNVDVYSKYIELYNLALKAFNRDFPNAD